jgi:hypothetical protein
MVTVSVDHGAQPLAGVKVSVLPATDQEPGTGGESTGIGAPGRGGADSETTMGVRGATAVDPCLGVMELTSGTGGSVVVVVAGREVVVLAGEVVVADAAPPACGLGPLANKPCFEAVFADMTDEATRPALATKAATPAVMKAVLQWRAQLGRPSAAVRVAPGGLPLSRRIVVLLQQALNAARGAPV